MKMDIISPIAIDLGAKNTGVYFPHYRSGSSLNEIEKQGKVYCLEKNSYTLLMPKRTASRHQRRGYDRRQMAKRLFKLLWEQHFKLPWNKEVQQTISFLLNRRGFSFLTEEYNADLLSRFPKEAYNELPNELREGVEGNGEEYDFASAIIEWVQNQGSEIIKKKYQRITEPSNDIRRNLLLIRRTKILKEYCQDRINGERIEEKKKNLGRLSKWILDEWKSSGIKGLEDIEVQQSHVDMVAFLNDRSPEQAQIIQSSIRDDREKERKLKKSIWNFEAEKFDLEKAEFIGQNGPNIATHLNHLAFAIHKTHEELRSGSRHRSRYFNEIKDVFKEVRTVLEIGDKNKTRQLHGYLRRFYENISNKQYGELNIDRLSNLLGHISNLELKPLRKYFNDRKHMQGDYWDETRLSEKFENWILREWRINPQKDKLKGEGKPYDYKELRNKWNNKSGTIIDFWLNTDPNWTVPPYQDNNNRRPPKCQSLILNLEFLDNHYGEWRNWLGLLKGLKSIQNYLGNYENQFSQERLKSGKKRPYFGQPIEGELKKDSGKRGQKHLDARVFQFILDRVKAEDPLKLNEIYSHTKKLRQRQSTSEEKTEQSKLLEKAIEESSLPNKLKTERNAGDEAVFSDGTFLHLVCRYYKVRQKARDSRIFIHPEYRYIKGRGYENTGRFDDKDHLLTYCNHKPRQKRYQILGDLAALLKVSPQQLEQIEPIKSSEGKSKEEKLLNWMESFDKLKTNCETAAKEQKKRRGRLKLDIQAVFGLIYHRKQSESPTTREIENILRSSRVDEASKLYRFCKRAKKLSLDLTRHLYTDKKHKQWQKDLKKNPAVAIYLLAQINNVVFKERGGNANTCAVCTMDNAQRMEIVSSRDGLQLTAKAQRLPAISTRLIDGAVKRMARIVGGAIANHKWEKIEKELEQNKKVCVPIIIESNRFEFEPSLKELKGKRLDNQDQKYRQSNPLADKRERIKNDCEGICPYTGESLSSEKGDIDHIVSRSSEYGTLNDEANLIWATEPGNRKIKGSRIFSLQDLHPKYKKEQFGPLTDDEIIEWIVEQLVDEADEFKFGRYGSFINLSPDEQKAFRHALFLVDHPLREEVISAIQNRTRTLVNGTQRYFAQTVADSLYKKAKSIGKNRHLYFDFFAVESQSNTRGDGVRDLREAYEKTDEEIAKYVKRKDEQQGAYSHLVDAQLAFVMIADAHRNDGGMGLTIDNSVSMWPYDQVTGEVYDNIFDKIKVEPEKMRLYNLARKKPGENFSSHRAFTRDTFYANHYLPILLGRENNSIVVRVGFDWQNSAKIKTNTKTQERKLLQDITQLLPLCNKTHQLADREYADLNDLFLAMEKTEYFAKQLSVNHYCYLTVNKLRLHECWRKLYNTRTGDPFNSKTIDYETLRYTTERFSIKKEEDLEEILNDDRKFSLKIRGDKITLPAKQQWKNCLDAWLKEKAEAESFDSFLQDYFRSHVSHPHQKSRKVFSLPVLTKQGKIMLQRKSWQGNNIFQIVNDSDSRGSDNKPNVSIRLDDGSLGIKLAKWARSKNIVKFPSQDKYQEGETINPDDWYIVNKNKNSLPDGIDQIWYRIDDSTAPTIAVKLAKDGKELEQKFMEEEICKHGFRKQNERRATRNSEAVPEKSPREVCNEFFKKEIFPAKRGDIICYKARDYNSTIKKAFKSAQRHKLE